MKSSSADHSTRTGTPGVMSNLRLVSLGTLLSRVLGLLRDMGMTALFGGGTIFDAFIVAFRVPNLARQLLGEGALSTAFLPVFIRSRDKSGMLAARETLSLTAVLLAAVLSAAVLATEVGIVVAWMTWELSEATQLLLILLAIMLPYSLLICLGALFCSALHAQRQFLWPALVPIVLNVIWLGGIVILWPTRLSLPTQAVLVACCVTAAGVVQLLIPLLALHSQGLGFVRKWTSGWQDVKEIIYAMVPVLIGMSILQASAILDSLLAWGLAQPDDGSQAWCTLLGIQPVLEAGTATAIYLGQRMLQFPLGIFGVALGTVLYPVLTQHAQSGEMNLLRMDLSRGIRIVIAVGVPASAGLCVIAWPLTTALFRWGHFNQESAILTSRMIAIYSAGVWSTIGIAILNRAWYATGDRITPMRLGLIALVLNQVLNLCLIWSIGGISFALSSVISSGCLCVVTLWKLNRHIGSLDWPSIVVTLLKGLGCTIVMTTATLAVMPLLPEPGGMLNKAILLGIPCVTGAAVYFVTSRWIGLTELDELLFRR